MCGGNVGLGGLGAVGTGADAGTGGGIGAGAFVAGLEIWPPVSGGDPPAPFVGGKTCGEEDGNSSKNKKEKSQIRSMLHRGNGNNVISLADNYLYKYFLFLRTLLTFTWERWWGRRFKEYRFGIRAL